MEKQPVEMNNLKRYGIAFQEKCVSALISDRAFLERIMDILSPEYFSTDAHKWIIKFVMEYFPKYRDVPTMSVFQVEVQNVQDNILQAALIEQLKIAYKSGGSSDITYVKEQFLEFCKNQKLKNAIWAAEGFLKTGDYDSIWNVINEASKAGLERNLGHDYYVDFEKRMSVTSRNIIKTNWDIVDTHLDGGLGKGELGFVCAPAGSGKSWILQRLGVEAIRQGKNVMHFTMELNEEYVGLRYDSCISGIGFQEIRKFKDIVRESVLKFKRDGGGQVFIKYFPIKCASASSLKMHIERLQLVTGIKIDLAIVDYADLLRPLTVVKNSNSYTDAGNVYEELRGVSGELQIPCWTASQSNRCLTLNTKVIVCRNNTEGNVDSIKNVRVGDKLLTHDGYKRVSNVFPVQSQPVYKIKLKSGREITCSSDHEFPVNYGIFKSISTGLSVGNKLFVKK